jgi:hypothetical protein
MADGSDRPGSAITQSRCQCHYRPALRRPCTAQDTFCTGCPYRSWKWDQKALKCCECPANVASWPADVAWIELSATEPPAALLPPPPTGVGRWSRPATGSSPAEYIHCSQAPYGLSNIWVDSRAEVFRSSGNAGLRVRMSGGTCYRSQATVSASLARRASRVWPATRK